MHSVVCIWIQTRIIGMKCVYVIRFLLFGDFCSLTFQMGAEDGDDFLAEVIEFGDGTQYTIKAESQGQPPDATHSMTVTQADDVPVTNAERFSEDFDPSCPRAQR